MHSSTISQPALRLSPRSRPGTNSPTACQSFAFTTECANPRMARLTEPPWIADPVWQQHKAALESWPAGLTVLELCAGAGTACVALELLLGPARWQTAGVYDRDPDLAPVHAVLHPPAASRGRVHSGPSGDVMAVNMASLPDANVIVAGPPCPPYSSIGKRAGLADDRARPFVRCIDIICHMASRTARQPLIFFLLENVVGVTFRPKGAAGSPLDSLQELLRDRLGQGWVLQRILVNANDYGLPQSRQRVYLVGRRTQCYPRGMPAVAQPFDSRLRARMLLQVADNIPRGDYTDRQVQNIKGWKAFYSASMGAPGRRGQVAFVDVSRDCSPRTVWGSGARREDMCECLTASGPAIHVFALGEGRGELSLDRPLRAAERAALQGFPVEFARVPLGEAAARRVFGNAMAVPVIGSLLAQELRALLRQLGETGVRAVVAREGRSLLALSVGAAPGSTRPTGHAPCMPMRVSAASDGARQGSDATRLPVALPMPQHPQAADAVGQASGIDGALSDSEAGVAPGLLDSAVRWGRNIGQAWGASRPGRVRRPPVRWGPADDTAFAARAAKRLRRAGLPDVPPTLPDSDSRSRSQDSPQASAAKSEPADPAEAPAVMTASAEAPAEAQRDRGQLCDGEDAPLAVLATAGRTKNMCCCHVVVGGLA